MSKTVSARLPTENIARTSKQEVLMLLTLAFLGFLILNALFARYFNQNDPNRGYMLVNQQWQALQNLEAPVDWLVLGDSSCGAGVVVDMIEQELGGIAAEFCVVGDMLAVNSAWMLQAYIQRFGAPQGVFIVHVYDLWARDETSLKGYMAAVDFPDGFEQWATPHIPLTLADRFRLKTTPVLPLLWRPFSVRQVVEQSLIPKQDVTVGSAQMVADAQAVSFAEDIIFHTDFVRANEFHLSSKNQEALNHLSFLAQEYHLDIYLVSAPLYETLYEDEMFHLYYGQVQAALATVTAENAYMHFLLSEPVLLPQTYLTDSVDHTNATGAKRFTEAVISARLNLIK